MAEEPGMDGIERRSRQRFVARWRGEYCFWALMDGERRPLVDLSLEGFAVPAARPAGTGEVFDFVLQRANVPDEIRGRARVVNHIDMPSGAQTGCLFVDLDGDGRDRLQDWLTAHVLANATVPISERDAASIVSGRSLI